VHAERFGHRKLGVVQASGLIRRAELGRIIKSVHLLNFFDNEVAFAKRAGHKIVGVFKVPQERGTIASSVTRSWRSLARIIHWGRSTQDLVETLDDLHSWKVSVLAQTGLTFDLSTSSGKLMRTIMAGLASGSDGGRRSRRLPMIVAIGNLGPHS
jgi:hypothetical protein